MTASKEGGEQSASQCLSGKTLYRLYQEDGAWSIEAKREGAVAVCAHITTREESARVLFSRVVRHRVSPHHLEEVTEDFLCE